MPTSPKGVQPQRAEAASSKSDDSSSVHAHCWHGDDSEEEDGPPMTTTTRALPAARLMPDKRPEGRTTTTRWKPPAARAMTPPRCMHTRGMETTRRRRMALLTMTMTTRALPAARLMPDNDPKGVQPQRAG